MLSHILRRTSGQRQSKIGTPFDWPHKVQKAVLVSWCLSALIQFLHSLFGKSPRSADAHFQPLQVCQQFGVLRFVTQLFRFGRQRLHKLPDSGCNRVSLLLDVPDPSQTSGPQVAFNSLFAAWRHRSSSYCADTKR